MRFSQSLYYPKLWKGIGNRQVLSQYQKINESQSASEKSAVGTGQTVPAGHRPSRPRVSMNGCGGSALTLSPSPSHCPGRAPRPLAPSPWLTGHRCAGGPSSPARGEQRERL